MEVFIAGTCPCKEQRERQGRVRMRLFRQQCHRCSSGKNEEPEFTVGDVACILKHLILSIRKGCYRERVDDSEHVEVIHDSSGPHKRGYCEACQLGIHKGHYGWPRKGGHHGKPHSPGFSWSTVNTESKTGVATHNLAATQAPPPANSLDPICGCAGCFLSIIIIIVIFIIYSTRLS